tara:strand:+ start:1015 stop:2337 length:1323 start_codon:yes stop_codon:yes gene_type:complete
MKITIIGTGYVGLVTGACFADAGHTVTCLDNNKLKIENLKQGIMPIYEKKLKNLIESNYREKRLFFTTSYKDALKSSKIVFIAVDTPPKKNGQANLSSIKNVCIELSKYIKTGLIIVEKSTVPVGTSDYIKKTIKSNLAKSKRNLKFHVVSNPEFLKEGTAIDDFIKPDRIIIGLEDLSLKEIFENLYRPFNRRYEKIHFMDIKSAELTKYAANAMLATKISFINELSNIADKVNADIDFVRKGIGADKRIGYEFLYPGCGYGGSCLPKDVDALINIALTNKYNPDLLSSVAKVNQRQKIIMYKKVKQFFKDKLKGKKISIWGLSFKPNTDDTRSAPSIDTIKSLIKDGAIINAYDPVASLKKDFSKFKKNYSESSNAMDTIKKADALLIFTEWKEFWSIDLNIFKKLMKQPVIFDGRNIYTPKIMKKYKIKYFSFGRKA